jgi:hypothetical protein
MKDFQKTTKKTKSFSKAPPICKNHTCCNKGVCHTLLPCSIVKKVENGIPKYILDVKTILEGCWSKQIGY